MAYYNVSVDVSDLFDDMLVQAQKSFLIDKFCSLATDQQIEVVSEMLENLIYTNAKLGELIIFPLRK